MMATQGTVLLAEDDPDDVLLTQIAFERARLANPLQVVRDGAEAIEYFKGEGKYGDRMRYPLPILLLLDLKMPKANGFHVLEWLRSTPLFRKLPVAVMTSSEDDPHVERAYRLGADSYLIKPPNAQTLLALVQRIHGYWMILQPENQFAAA
jgi:CheY-like chemotaxis protein